MATKLLGSIDVKVTIFGPGLRAATSYHNQLLDPYVIGITGGIPDLSSKSSPRGLSLSHGEDRPGLTLDAFLPPIPTAGSRVGGMMQAVILPESESNINLAFWPEGKKLVSADYGGDLASTRPEDQIRKDLANKYTALSLAAAVPVSKGSGTGTMFIKGIGVVTIDRAAIWADEQTARTIIEIKNELTKSWVFGVMPEPYVQDLGGGRKRMSVPIPGPGAARSEGSIRLFLSHVEGTDVITASPVAPTGTDSDIDTAAYRAAAAYDVELLKLRTHMSAPAPASTYAGLAALDIRPAATSHEDLSAAVKTEMDTWWTKRQGDLALLKSKTTVPDSEWERAHAAAIANGTTTKNLADYKAEVQASTPTVTKPEDTTWETWIDKIGAGVAWAGDKVVDLGKDWGPLGSAAFLGATSDVVKGKTNYTPWIVAGAAILLLAK